MTPSSTGWVSLSSWGIGAGSSQGNRGLVIVARFVASRIPHRAQAPSKKAWGTVAIGDKDRTHLPLRAGTSLLEATGTRSHDRSSSLLETRGDVRDAQTPFPPRFSGPRSGCGKDLLCRLAAVPRRAELRALDRLRPVWTPDRRPPVSGHTIRPAVSQRGRRTGRTRSAFRCRPSLVGVGVARSPHPTSRHPIRHRAIRAIRRRGWRAGNHVLPGPLWKRARVQGLSGSRGSLPQDVAASMHVAGFLIAWRCCRI